MTNNICFDVIQNQSLHKQIYGARWGHRLQHFICQTLLENMSRCQHGQVISQFCISESCAWRQAGGCPNCILKYHQHAHNIDMVKVQKLEQYIRLLSVGSEVKPKSRVLQEAVSNYFIIVKNQICTSLDTISRNISNKLMYPYIMSQNQYGVIKKIRQKQYKKIGKKQLQSFCAFVTSQNKTAIENNQNKLYKEEITELTAYMSKINETFNLFAKVSSKYDPKFNVQHSFYNKIIEICNSIQPNTNQETLNFQNEKKGHNIYKNGNNKISNEKKNLGRERKVSLDYGMVIDSNKFRSVSVNQSFDENQKQIVEKKKKLFDMLNNPQRSKQLQKHVENNIQKKQTKQKIIEKSKQLLQIQNKEQRDYDQHGSRNEDAQMMQLDEEGKQVKINNEQKERFPLFDELLSKGINLPQIIIAHTQLPRQASRQKLYEDTKDVKQRRITIPVKKFKEDEQSFSPILKQKRKKKEEDRYEEEQYKISLINKNSDNKINEQLKQVSQNQTNSQRQNFALIETPKKEKEEEKLLLKDKQADSLALLIESLPLPAQRAIPLLEASIKFAYNNLSAAQYLSYLYLQISKPKNCLQLCNKILEQLEDSSEADQLSIHINNNKAAALNMLGRYSESITILQKCLTKTKRDVYYKNLGDAYFSISIYQKAILNYENAIKMNTHMEQAYYNLAVCYYIQDHFHQAKLNVQKAIKTNEKNEQYLKLNREITMKMQL